MKNREQLTKDIALFIDDLEMPLSQEELAAGWTVDCQTAMLKLVREIHMKLVDSQPIGKVSFGCGLNSWGIDQGQFLERACVLANEMREFVG